MAAWEEGKTSSKILKKAWQALENRLVVVLKLVQQAK